MPPRVPIASNLFPKLQAGQILTYRIAYHLEQTGQHAKLR